jgi:DNA-binding GntR family transcriptional regulator
VSNAIPPKQALAVWLKAQILTLELAPGADLDEARLTARFNLSRTPLREVFRALAGEGYLSLRENRSARVSDMSHTTLRDFFIAAPMVYAAILRLAAMNRTAAQLDMLRAAQEAFRAALRHGGAADRALANNRFHEVTGDMAGNIYLLPSFRRLLIDHARVGVTFYRPQAAEMIDTLDEASQQHEAIINAITAQDEAAAGALAEAHWALSRDRIESFVMPRGLDIPLGGAPVRTSA